MNSVFRMVLFFLTDVYLIHGVMLVSDVQQSDSFRCVYILF